MPSGSKQPPDGGTGDNGHRELTEQDHIAIIATAKEHDLYEGPVPEAADKRRADAEELLQVRDQAHEQGLDHPGVKALYDVVGEAVPS